MAQLRLHVTSADERTKHTRRGKQHHKVAEKQLLFDDCKVCVKLERTTNTTRAENVGE